MSRFLSRVASVFVEVRADNKVGEGLSEAEREVRDSGARMKQSGEQAAEGFEKTRKAIDGVRTAIAAAAAAVGLQRFIQDFDRARREAEKFEEAVRSASKSLDDQAASMRRLRRGGSDLGEALRDVDKNLEQIHRQIEEQASERLFESVSIGYQARVAALRAMGEDVSLFTQEGIASFAEEAQNRATKAAERLKQELRKEAEDAARESAFDARDAVEEALAGQAESLGNFDEALHRRRANLMRQTRREIQELNEAIDEAARRGDEATARYLGLRRESIRELAQIAEQEIERVLKRQVQQFGEALRQELQGIIDQQSGLFGNSGSFGSAAIVAQLRQIESTIPRNIPVRGPGEVYP